MKLKELDNQILLLTPSWSSAMDLCWFTPMYWRLEGSGGLNAEIDAETNPEDVVFLFPDHSINYGCVLVHEESKYGDKNIFCCMMMPKRGLISHTTISGPRDIFLSVRIYSS